MSDFTPLPPPTPGPPTHAVTIELSKGEHATLTALAQRWGSNSIESALTALVLVDLRKRYDREQGGEELQL